MKKIINVTSDKIQKEFVVSYDKNFMFEVLKSEFMNYEYVLDEILVELVNAIIEGCPIAVRKEVGNE